VERAEALYGLPVASVVGGLHYEGANAQDLEPHIQFLQARQPKVVALSSHCRFASNTPSYTYLHA
jgi:metal-dependent hydrolase (beta-lactamase superfamily II)